MTGRLSFALALLAAAPAFAQPAPKPADDMVAFEKDLDALFTIDGMTADRAASRAAKASPAVRRKAAEIDAALAQVESAQLAEVPQIGCKASYTRLSYVKPFVIPFMGQSFTIPSLQTQ